MSLNYMFMLLIHLPTFVPIKDQYLCHLLNVYSSFCLLKLYIKDRFLDQIVNNSIGTKFCMLSRNIKNMYSNGGIFKIYTKQKVIRWCDNI